MLCGLSPLNNKCNKYRSKDEQLKHRMDDDDNEGVTVQYFMVGFKCSTHCT